MKTFAMTIHPYNQSLTVHRCSFDHFLRWADKVHPRRNTLDADDRDAVALSLLLGGKHVMWIDSGRSASSTREHIVHEAFHIAVRVLEQAGMRLTRDSEEAYAYLQTYLYWTVATRLGVA